MKINFKIILLVALGFILNTLEIKAQKTVALNHNGTSKFYARIDSAIFNAQHGDTIYIAGGNYTIVDLNINKKLVILGAGINPDTTNATNQTYLNGTTFINDGADSSYIEGIYFNGDIRVGNTTNNQAVDNIVISRCFFNNIYLGYTTPSTAKDFLIKECIVNGSITGNNAQNVFVSNCIISNQISYFDKNAVFNNNIFLKNTSYQSSMVLLYNVNEITLNNNIFLSIGGYVVQSSSSTFNNNIFCENYVFPNASNIGSNNIMSISQASIFENQTGNTFSFAHNYHLKATCVGINAGTDGNDIGIYGGNFPFKDGSNPINPHFKSKQISTTTNNGKIGVNLNVNAQDN